MVKKIMLNDVMEIPHAGKFGGFSKDSSEFVVTNPATPRPWINYLCTRDGAYVSLLSANAVLSTKTYWVTGASANIQENKAWDQVAFMAASIPSAGFAGEREEFFGPYRDERNPIAVETGELRSARVSSGNLVSSMKLNVSLEPSEDIKFHITLGAAEKGEGDARDAAALALIAKFADSSVVENALREVRGYWSEYCSAVQVETPDETMNSYLNAWNQYQGKITFINSRNASYYHWGVHHRGMGFRDALQDTISVVPAEPELARDRLLLLASYQRSDGVCAHCFHPISGEAEFTGHKDDPLWLITAVWYYLAETDDASILSADVAFHDGVSAAMLDHLKASVSFIENNLGPNGIPTFGRGDAEGAVDLYRRVAPCSFDQERYQIEPYVYAQYTTSDEHETFGQGSHAWLTGTAAWMFRSALDHILGIRATLDGLVVDPCAPPEWGSFNVVREYRGKKYEISANFADGDWRLTVNGEQVQRGEILD